MAHPQKGTTVCQVCKSTLPSQQMLNDLRFCSRICLQEWMRENPPNVK